jgi:hypothetical protein
MLAAEAAARSGALGSVAAVIGFGALPLVPSGGSPAGPDGRVPGLPGGLPGGGPAGASGGSGASTGSGGSAPAALATLDASLAPASLGIGQAGAPADDLVVAGPVADHDISPD